MKRLLSIAAITLFVVGLTGCKTTKSACCGTDGECCKKAEAAEEPTEVEPAGDAAIEADGGLLI